MPENIHKLQIPLINNNLYVELVKFEQCYFIKSLEDYRRLKQYLDMYLHDPQPFTSADNYTNFLRDCGTKNFHIDTRRTDNLLENTEKKIFSPSMNDIVNISNDVTKIIEKKLIISPHRSNISINQISRSKQNSRTPSPRPTIVKTSDRSVNLTSRPRTRSNSLNFKNYPNINNLDQTFEEENYQVNQLGRKLDINGGSQTIATNYVIDNPVVVLYFSNGYNQNAIVYNDKLIELYNQINADRKNFELVFINVDVRKVKKKDHKEQHYKFIENMPWPCLQYDTKPVLDLLGKFEHKCFPSQIPLKKNGSAIPKIDARYMLENQGMMAVLKWKHLSIF